MWPTSPNVHSFPTQRRRLSKDGPSKVIMSRCCGSLKNRLAFTAVKFISASKDCVRSFERLYLAPQRRTCLFPFERKFLKGECTVVSVGVKPKRGSADLTPGILF